MGTTLTTRHESSLKIGDLIKVSPGANGIKLVVKVVEQVELEDIRLNLPKHKVEKPYYRQMERY